MTHWLAWLRWLADGLPGRLHAACITNNHPSVIDRRVCRANPLGQPEPMFCSTSDDPFPTPITSTLPIPADSTYTYPTPPHGPCTPTAGASLQPSLPPTQTHLLRNLHTPHHLLSRRLSDSQIAGKQTPVALSWGGSRRTLGHPIGRPQRVTHRNTQNSCGDTNGSTLHVAKQVRGIQNPQSCRQTHWISRFPSAPFLASIPAERIAFRPVRIIAGVSLI